MSETMSGRRDAVSTHADLIRHTADAVNDYHNKSVDLVNHPPHYNHGAIEVIDYIEDQKFNYNLGNVIKYVSRAFHKGTTLGDLSKARWYLEREIARLQNS